MPPSKQARARQARQRERLAELHAERADKRQRRRRIGAIAGVLVVVLAVLLALVVAPMAGNDDDNNTAAAPTTVAAGEQCAGLKDPLPKGAPKVDIPPGPAPAALVKRDLKVGTGAEVPEGAQKVTVNYIGIACSTGKIFDSSWSRNETFDANLAGGVIEGWQQGVPGMKVGGRRVLEIPSELAYGQQGSGPIAPNEPLIFVIDVVAV
jgi:peptidylprolyl isomerase